MSILAALKGNINLPVDYTKLTAFTKRQVREEYTKQQQGKCWHCGEPLTANPSKEIMATSITAKLFPTTFFHWPVHLHHCHKTGMTIGAVHNKCNAVLWQYFHE